MTAVRARRHTQDPGPPLQAVTSGSSDAGLQGSEVYYEAATPTGPRSSAAWPTRARRSCTLGMTGVDEMVAAAARQPGGTLMLRSDRLTPAELADEVLAAADLRQVL
jgi:hypothetical protein